jgi:hypothetical protein
LGPQLLPIKGPERKLILDLKWLCLFDSIRTLIPLLFFLLNLCTDAYATLLL